MAKKFEGLDTIIQPTTEMGTEAQGKSNTSPTLEYVNSNIPLLKEQHLQLRILAMKQGKTLKQLLPEIIGAYLDQHKEQV